MKRSCEIMPEKMVADGVGNIVDGVGNILDTVNNIPHAVSNTTKIK